MNSSTNHLSEPDNLPDPVYAAIAADNSVTSGKPWLLEIKSSFLKRTSFVVAVIIMIIHIIMAIVVVKGTNTGITLTRIDQWAFIGIGLVFASLMFIFWRPHVRVNQEGVEVRNMLNKQFYPWSMIHGLSFPQGTRWARLELPEFEFIPVWALQIGDKKTIASDVEAFRALEDKFMPVN